MPETILVSKNPAMVTGDDQPMIQAALEGIHNRGGGVVRLTGAKYTIGSSIKIHSNTLLL